MKKSRALRPSTIASGALLLIVSVIIFFPFLWMLTSAAKPYSEIYHWPIVWWPSKFEFANFVNAWNAIPFGRIFLNSIVVTVIGTLVKMILACMVAYAFVFIRFPYRDVIFLFFLGALMVPGNVVIIVNFLTVSSVGWVNTFAGLIVPGMGSIFGMFLLRQHMRTIPSSVIEAAQIDGAGHIRTLLRIVLPMSKAPLITVGLVAAVEEWNSFIWPLIITNTMEMKTLPIGLLALKDSEGYEDWGAIMAGTSMVVIPILVLFFLTQRHIVSGFTQSALK